MNPNITKIKNAKLKQIIKDVIEIPLIPFEEQKKERAAKTLIII